MARKKYFKVILHRDVVGKKDFSYIDIESSGQVSTCFSKVRLSEEMKKMPAGKYKLEIMRVSIHLLLYAHCDHNYFSIFESKGGDGLYLYEGESYEDYMKAKMHWQHIHKETYLAMRDRYPATIEIVDERNLKRINFI